MNISIAPTSRRSRGYVLIEVIHQLSINTQYLMSPQLPPAVRHPQLG